MIITTKSFDDRVRRYKKITMILVILIVVCAAAFIILHILSTEKCTASDFNSILPVEVTQTAITKERACRNVIAVCIRNSPVPSQCKIKE